MVDPCIQQPRVSITIRSGEICSSSISLSPNHAEAKVEVAAVHERLHGLKLHAINDWAQLLKSTNAFRDPREADMLGRWLNGKLGSGVAGKSLEDDDEAVASTAAVMAFLGAGGIP